MTAPFAIRKQIRLVAELRWRIFRNSLRTMRGRLDAVSVGILWLMMTGLALGGGVGMAFGAYFFVAHRQAPQLADLFWVIFLFWQFYPILAGTGGAHFDFTYVLRFPLRYGSFFALSLAYGLFDPSAVAGLFWLVCLSVGVGMARPALFPWALAVSLLFAVMNLLLARAVSTWADRWFAQRRTREILGMVIVLLVLVGQFALPALSDWAPGKRIAEHWIPPLLHAAHVLPPSLAGRTLASAVAASWLAAFTGFLFVCLYAGAFLWLLHARLVAQYRGENLSESRVVAPAARRAPRAPGTRPSAAAAWRLPWLSSATAALFEREARYTLRNWPMLLQLLFPAFFVLVLSPSLKHTPFLVRHRDVVFPLAVAYAFFQEANWFFNNLAYDGTGIRFLLLAPVPFRRVMVAKNLFHAAATLFNILVLWICVSWLFGPPRLTVVAATLSAALYALLVNFAVGNVVSVRFPTRLDFGAFRRGQGARHTAALAGLATELVLIGTGAVVFFVGQLLGGMGLALVIFLVLACAAAVGYFISLRLTDRDVLSRRESIAEELCRAPGSS